MTKLEICYEVYSSNTKISHATVNHIPGLNKVATEVRTQNSQIIFPTLDLNFVKVITYIDETFYNFSQGESQGSQMSFISKNKKVAQSYRTHQKLSRKWPILAAVN